MDKIYNRIRRLLPVATNNHHPKNRAFQISFVGLFVLLLLKSGVWQLAILTPEPFSPSEVFFSDGTDTHTNKHTNRTTDITDRRLNRSKGRFSENQTETDIFSGWLPSVTTSQNNLVTMTMTMTMMMLMTMTMTMTMTMKHLYSSLFTNLVGRDEPVVSLGTYSEFTEYMAAMRGQLLSSRMDIRTYTFCQS